MTQREGNFKGGIQKGTMAWDNESLALDKYLKETKSIISDQFPELRMVTQFSKADKLKYVGDDCFGFAPDGGAWFLEDKLLAVFEAKKQGEQGNAYERWWDNAATAQYINKDVYYVTFCSGKGASKGSCLDKLRRKAKIMAGKNFEFHMSPNGFSAQEVKNIMIDTLERALFD